MNGTSIEKSRELVLERINSVVSAKQTAPVMKEDSFGRSNESITQHHTCYFKTGCARKWITF